MTKKEKKPAKGPELPPSRACFPQPPVIKPTGLDPKTLKPRSVAIDELHSRNRPHFARWSRVRAMEEMTSADFKKRYGYKKTFTKICELVAVSGRRLLKKAAIWWMPQSRQAMAANFLWATLLPAN
jgi:hypothetical protein